MKEKPQVVEAEIIDENGIVIGPKHENSFKQEEQRGSFFSKTLAGIAMLAFGFLFSLLLTLLALIIFIPIMILKIFLPIKTNIKVNRFR